METETEEYSVVEETEEVVAISAGINPDKTRGDLLLGGPRRCLPRLLLLPSSPSLLSPTPTL